MGDLSLGCKTNNLLMNISKTKELVVDFGSKQQRNYAPLRIDGTFVEIYHHRESDMVHIHRHLGLYHLLWEFRKPTIISSYS